MSINGITFIFILLPLSLIAYYLVRDAIKEYILLAVCLFFYAFGSVRYFILFIISIGITVFIGRLIDYLGSRNKPFQRLLLVLGIVYNISILGYYKYYDFAVSTVGDITGREFELKNLILPLGISFFTFKAISYLIDVYKDKVVLEQNPLHDALYLSFFAQIQSGPLSRYSDMSSRTLSYDYFSQGVYRFLIGCNKKVLLANTLAHIVNEVYSTPLESYSQGYAWLGAICFSLQLYYDFSGYSDMAIGLTQMFGYSCPENFIYPYTAPSVSKFWQRWHVTLGAWFRDYIYIPMGGSRCNRVRICINLFVVWLLTGIWHGSAWNFVAWGLGYFILIAFEKMTGLPDRIQFTPFKIIYRILTLLFINFQWVLFRAPNLLTGLRFIRRMLYCDENVVADMRTVFLIKDYLPFIITAIILCVPVIPYIEKRFSDKNIISTTIRGLIAFVVLAGFVWSISIVVAGQNNPFAYANF